MKVVILCGGFGTRIRDVADDIPKPMIPIGRYPILWHIMKRYASFGHKEFVLCLGYKSQVIKDFFLNYEAHTKDFTISLGRSGGLQFHNDHDESDWRVTLAETGLNAMTGARVRRIRNYIGNDEHFMLTYGDGVGDVDIDKLLAFHKAHGKTLTVTGVRPPGRFGELVAGDDGVISEFNEKPQATAGRISGGFFVCSRGLFDYLDDREDLMFEQEPMARLVADRQLAMYQHDGFWQPMDTSREYQLLNAIYAKGSAPWVR
ncbi:MAG: glucose-1-phosphate cytidylyltransferase [Candidatus Protistobacter heckmanni]|nr:glucose-1-phosphate cytidylyltransferase [Candidatus Protistobacter heckmanni]